MISRRSFLTAIVGSGALIRSEVSPPKRDSIDRKWLVQRHNPVLRQLDPLSPLSLGNGEFAFTADITGLQTLPQSYENAMPLCTMSQWGWHTKPAPADLDGSPAMQASDWQQTNRHQTTVVNSSAGSAKLHRKVDSDQYFVTLKWNNSQRLVVHEAHSFVVTPARASSRLELVVEFSAQKSTAQLPGVSATLAASAWECLVTRCGPA